MQQSAKKKLDDFTVDLPLKKYSRGQILLAAGDEPKAVFYLVSGQVRQYDISNQGDEVVVNVFKPATFFPMTWAINQTPNQFFFAADTDVELKLVHTKDVLLLLKSEPDITFDLLSRLLSGVGGLQRRMAHIMGGEGHRRVLYELLIACKRFGVTHDDGSVELSMTQAELAHQAGLSRETVNKELKKLKQSGNITTSNKKIIIDSITTIESLLGQEL
ncbi:MAG: Crp/Fnr family transcriptional regulator [Actinobacteria bacterium]|nr:Crp/Fnr family transcriptional regulator [Actinomycetota bacterium]